ncbi:hypothetical protein [Demequina sp. NBRC 110057]|uniref:hypothetical protein n=1 Tax=Demequina sp. NBRC 110057 TaxID=1570346 RepID=UPI0009FDF638|nr:hypothetical protein [Demequina sp. NBRC 110057]
MSGGTLKVDTAMVRTMATYLTTVHAELGRADARSHAVADAVGDAHLADTLRNFSDAWDNRREEMVGQIGTFRDAAKAVADAFDQAESELAATADQARS